MIVKQIILDKKEIQVQLRKNLRRKKKTEKRNS